MAAIYSDEPLRVRQPGHKVVAQCGLGEARADGRAGDADELVVAQTEVLAGDRVLAADAGAEVRRVVGAERERNPGLAQDGEGVLREAREDPEDDVARRAHLERDLPARELGDERGVLDRAHAVGDPRDRQLERAADRVRAGPLARVHGAAEARGGRDPVGLGVGLGRVAGLVAGQREADHVGVRPRGGVLGDLDRALDAEVAHGHAEDARLDAVVAARVVDARGDPLPVLGVAQAGQPRVVDRRGQLDVDRARRRRRRRGTRRRRHGSPGRCG